MPYFSIIIPSFNRANIINSTIQSVLQQSFQDFQIIIVDDGSTDNSKEIIAAYLTDPRIKYNYQNNSGVCTARNTGARNAIGEYLIFLDSDDTVEREWLKDFYDLTQENNYDIVYCNVKMIYPDGNFKLINADNPYGLVKNYGIKGTDLTGSWVIKKTMFFKVGMYDENIKFGENNELRLRFQYGKLNVGITDKCNLIYNVSIGGGGKNYSNKLTSLLYILDKHREYYNRNKNSKKLFLQSAAVSAVRIGEIKKANELFGIALRENKGNFTLWIQFLISTNKYIARLKWKSVNL